MRDTVSILLLLTAVSTGCGMDAEVVDETLQHRIRWTQEPETEIQDCHTFKLGNTRTVEVNRLKVDFASGSHHVHIYRSSTPVEDSVEDCFNGIDWTKWSLVIGAQTEAMDWQLPEGVTLPFEPHQQLLAQVHWLNTTDKPEQPTIDIAFHTTEESEEHLGVVFGVNQRVDIPANSFGERVEHFCQMQDGVKLHAMMGHFHARGVDYRVIERMPDQTTGTEIYFAKNEPAFEFKLFSPARPIARGAGLQYECGFDNRGNGINLTWGSDTKTQEHCNMTAYFSPAEKVSEMCVLEPSKLAGLKPAKETVRAGQELTMMVELAKPEPADVDVALTSSDASALTVPASVRIPAGATHATFNATALRPAHVEVTASLHGARVIRPIRVTGLVISELFYLPGTGATGDDLQWVEVANLSDEEVDLTGYRLGAGSRDFMETQAALPMTIPARGCIVIGGTQSVPTNYLPPLAVIHNFTPDLGTGRDEVSGIGLFATGQGISPTLRPIDVLVYGDENTANNSLNGPDGNLAPVWQGSAPGGSIRRVNDTIWTPSSVPTPGVCEVFNAVAP